MKDIKYIEYIEYQNDNEYLGPRDMRDMFLFLYILGTYQISQIYQIYQIDQGRFFYIIVFSDISGMYQITCGGPDPVGGLGGGG